MHGVTSCAKSSLYSLDRPTPEPNLVKVSKEEMVQFVAPLVAEGFNVSIA